MTPVAVIISAVVYLLTKDLTLTLLAAVVAVVVIKETEERKKRPDPKQERGG